MVQAGGVGRLLREWRARRGMSQLDLAVEAGVSSRHLSFVETGRATPSREMVVLLARALDVPFRDRNDLLTAAGYAAIYRATSLDAPALAQARRALDFILRQQEPYPALVLDRHWNVLKVNEGSARVQALFLDAAAVATLGTPHDITLQELRVESFFPADELTVEMGGLERAPHTPQRSGRPGGPGAPL